MTEHAARDAWLAMVTRRAGPAMVGVVLLAATTPATAGPPPDNNWHFSLTPYLWVPGFDGDFKFTAPAGGGVPGVHAGPADVLAKLQFAFMGTFEARYFGQPRRGARDHRSGRTD